MREEATEHLQVPGIVLGVGDLAVNQTQIPAFLVLIFERRRYAINILNKFILW